MARAQTHRPLPAWRAERLRAGMMRVSERTRGAVHERGRSPRGPQAAPPDEDRRVAARGGCGLIELPWRVAPPIVTPRAGAWLRPRSNKSFNIGCAYGFRPRPVLATFTPRQYALRARWRDGYPLAMPHAPFAIYVPRLLS